MFSWLQRRKKPVLRSPVADVVRENFEIATHMAKFGADQPEAWIMFDEKRFSEFAVGVMWNCSLRIFDRIGEDRNLVEEFDNCGGDLLFLECAIFPPLAVMVLEREDLLGQTGDFEAFYEVLEAIYSDLETYFSGDKSAMPEFQQQRIELYMFMEGVEDWFKAVCSRFYQVLLARSRCRDGALDVELKPVHPMLEGNFSTSLGVQLIAESELSDAIDRMKGVLYEFSEDANY